jgi:hypothetical protein
MVLNAYLYKATGEDHPKQYGPIAEYLKSINDLQLIILVLALRKVSWSRHYYSLVMC